MQAKVSSILAAMIIAATSRAVAQTDAREEWSRQVDAARERHDAFAARAIAAFRDAVAARRETRPREFRLDDPTLRPGDIVVTPTSLLLFKGSPKCAYDEEDFERLDELRARRLRHSKTLRAILRRGFARGRRE
jgi:hypothetical protein